MLVAGCFLLPSYLSMVVVAVVASDVRACCSVLVYVLVRVVLCSTEPVVVSCQCNCCTLSVVINIHMNTAIIIAGIRIMHLVHLLVYLLVQLSACMLMYLFVDGMLSKGVLRALDQLDCTVINEGCQ